MSAIGPLGLAVKAYGAFSGKNNESVSIVGAQANASAGTSSTSAPLVQLSQLTPLGLSAKPRDISPKQTAQEEVSPPVTLGLIEAQAAEPDSSHTTIYIDGAESLAQAGTTTIILGVVTGSEISADAGTSTASIGISFALTGASTSASSGESAGIGGIGGTDVVGMPASGAIVGNSGSISGTTSFAVDVTGAFLSASAAEPGIDTPTSVAVTLVGAAVAFNATVMAESGSLESPTIDGVALAGIGGAITVIDERFSHATTATTDVPTHYEICDRTGFRVRRGKLVGEWDGKRVRKDSYEPKHPQLTIRGIEQGKKGSVSPEQDNEFISTAITPDDL